MDDNNYLTSMVREIITKSIKQNKINNINKINTSEVNIL